MATISESYTSRTFTLARQSARELTYDVRGTDDETAVQTLLLSTAPSTYQGLELESVEAEPIGNKNWKARARYVRVNDNEYTFDTGGGTAHVTQSITTINRYGIGAATAPDFEGAIGVTEDRVEGVDIPAPQYQFSETHYFAAATVTDAYKLALFGLTGRVNNATFRGFAAGECLFLGASGAKRGDERWGITFRFSCQPNQTGLSIGSISGVAKKGWEYLWIRYQTYEDSTARSLVQRPVAAYVEQVFYPGDFTGLLI
jgi:hypothetical protein